MPNLKEVELEHSTLLYATYLQIYGQAQSSDALLVMLTLITVRSSDQQGVWTASVEGKRVTGLVTEAG